MKYIRNCIAYTQPLTHIKILKNMKRHLVILTFAFLTLNSCNNEVKKELTGNSFTIWKTDVNGNKIEKSEYKQFDEKGNLLKWIQFGNGNALVDSFSYEYKDNLLIKKFRFTNGVLFSQTTFEYNENNMLKLETEFDRNNVFQSSSKHIYLADNVKAIENYSNSNELYSIDSLKYDNKGNLIEETQFLSDGYWFQHHTYEFDNNNNLIIQKSEANPEFDGVGIVEYKFEYNAENKKVKKTANVPDTGLEYYYYEYDK